MFKRRYVTLLPLFVLLAACSSKPKPTETDTTTGTPSGGFLLEPQHNVMQMGGDFANNPNAQQFIDKMVNKHGFDRQQLQEILSQAKRLDSVLRLMDNQAPTTSVKPPSGPNGAWLRYRKKFITPDNVQNGVVFWNQYEDALNRAWQVYGVPPEIIVGIIGVETRWGRVMGKTRILDALATLSFNYPRRAEYFSGELETFLLMARDEQDDPLNLKGSFAGAMGYGQFMPSSYKQYAVDFSGDGHINLWDPVDAIGSVANYFKAHGWVKGDQVAVMANGQAPGLPNGFKTKYSISQLAAAGLTPQQPLGNHQQASLLRLDVGTGYQYWYGLPNFSNGFKTKYSISQLAAAGLTPQQPLGNHQQASLLRLDVGTGYQYWYGLPNFYTITRYNHSTHYAMAVWQLGQAVALARVQ
ncbi:TPA: lytic murein transglycosylase B [Escherichia coli]|nr:lytic murein transglycosylase B [Escherichia coli]